MQAPRENVERAFRAAAWRERVADLHAGRWLFLTIALALVAIVFILGAPERPIGDATGVIGGVHMTATKTGRAPLRVSVRLDDGRVVPVSIVAASGARPGDRVVLRVMEREWPPYSQRYEFERRADDSAP